jgi:hypothetical protein
MLQVLQRISSDNSTLALLIAREDCHGACYTEIFSYFASVLAGTFQDIAFKWTTTASFLLLIHNVFTSDYFHFS